MDEHSHPLLEQDASSDPIAQFGRWFAEASASTRVPEAVALATATADGRPSVRMVLMKQWDERGFVFYTNKGSRKGAELETNPVCALLFYWDRLGRQVRIEGPVSQVSEAESDEYFATRPVRAQVAARASRQSRVVASREELDRRVRKTAAEFLDGVVPRPESWGGFRVRPDVFEFWQNREDRLHDRLRYTRVAAGSGGIVSWRLERLQP